MGGSLKSRFICLSCHGTVKVALGMAGPPPFSSMLECPHVFMAGRLPVGRQDAAMLWFMLLLGLFFHCSMVSASEMAQPAEGILGLQGSSKEKPQVPSPWSLISELYPSALLPCQHLTFTPPCTAEPLGFPPLPTAFLLSMVMLLSAHTD